MRILIEISLTICEWIQERNIRRAARKAARECEKKSILTYLSQGAVGGIVGYFLLVAASIVLQPSGYSFIFFFVLPIFLAFGAFLGSITTGFVWLAAKLLKRRPGFVARSAIVLSITTLLSIGLSYWTSELPGEQWSWLWKVGFVCALDLPIVLVTGSGIRPGHLIFLGARPRSKRHNFGSWLAYPAGALLRVASIFAFLESLLALAIWISARTSEWFDLFARERLLEIALAAIYFATSTYFSIKTPRKLVLLPTAILLNVPLAFLIVSQQRSGTPYSEFLVYSFAGFIGLWAIYTLGRLIAPEPSSGLFKSSPGIEYSRHAAPGEGFLVQL
jgi:MFS family permease